jgi:hypothetical protein
MERFALESFESNNSGVFALKFIERVGLHTEFETTKHNYTQNDHPPVVMNWEEVGKISLTLANAKH